MNEDFLHYIWRFRKFNQVDLRTTQGQIIEVISTGTYNPDAGPDFLNARIRIDETLWVGNVEVHINASQWFDHKHDQDPAYENVILHVVYSEDREVFVGANYLPTLELRDRFDYQMVRFYKSWLKKGQFIPCENQVSDVPGLIKNSTIEEMAVQRIKEKSETALDQLQETNGDIEETLFRLISRALGLKVNAIPFEILSRSIPYRLLRKESNELIKLEALVLGQAGFLSKVNLKHPYLQKIQNEYNLQVRKYGLEPMPIQSWKHLRLRPDNFPELRLAQLAALYHRQIALAQSIIEINSGEKLFELFSDVQLQNSFWDEHYSFKKESTKKKKVLGMDRIHIIIVNAIVPFLFALASYNRNDVFKERAIKILENLKPELNKITNKFVELKFSNSSALESQGLINLKTRYCDLRRCLRCKIGFSILNTHEKSSQPHI